MRIGAVCTTYDMDIIGEPMVPTNVADSSDQSYNM